MTYHIDIQHATQLPIPFTDEQIISWASLALRDYQQQGELTVRYVDPTEMIDLNNTYRQQNKPTNVLAFPSTIPEIVDLPCPFLGDIIICPEVLAQESLELNKSPTEHWALIIIHGILHLLGYDHIEDDDTEIMQAIEVKLLAELGYANPYDEELNRE